MSTVPNTAEANAVFAAELGKRISAFIGISSRVDQCKKAGVSVSSSLLAELEINRRDMNTARELTKRSAVTEEDAESFALTP